MSATGRRYASAAGALALVVAFAWLVAQQPLWERALSAIFPGSANPVYPGVTLADLVVRHLAIVGFSSGLTMLVGIPLGVWVTRPSGADFREVVAAAVDFGQTFPPIAVLALMVPILGFGLGPAIVALFLYGLFPVVSNTVAGIEGVPRTLVDAARGMGMGRARILLTLEVPLAARVIMAGVRTSVVINIGTATVAAAVGAGGLGDPIIRGINVQNFAYVLQGATAAALLAVVADSLLAVTERLLTPRGLEA